MLRHFPCRILVLIALIAAATLAMGSVAPAFAQSPQIEQIRSEAEKSRAFADKQKQIAEKWRKQAEQAHKRAEESKHHRDREGWLEDAKTYEASAQKAQVEADNAEALAAKAEAELVEALKKLEKGPPDATPAPAAPQKKLSVKPQTSSISVQDVYGVWLTDMKDSLFVVVPEKPEMLDAYAFKLEAHTKDRVWKGEFTDFEEGDIRRSQNARVVFKYTPKSEEINPEIPEWARKKIAGQLEWEIELNEPQVCGAKEKTLEGKFFPGKVKWNADQKIVKLDGRGEPRPLTLTLQKYDPESAYVSTSIRIRPPGLGTRSKEDPDILLPFTPLTTLVEKQLFHVDVSLPYELAKEQGEKLEITLRGMSGGKSKTITLQSNALRKGRPTKYTHYNPIFLGASKPFMSESWLAEIGSHSENIDLGLKNGESVFVGFGDTYEVVPVYKTMEDLTLARYLQAAGYLQKIHNIRLNTGEAKKEKEDAHIRLLRLSNFLKMMENPDHPKWLKVLIANEYLGPVEDVTLVLHDPRKMYGAGQVRIEDINKRAYMEGTIDSTWSNNLNDWERDGNNDKQLRFPGVVWSNGYERIRVTQLVGSAWRERVQKAFDTFMVDLTKGLYEWALSESSITLGKYSIGVSDLYAIISGEDHYGKTLSKSQRLHIIGTVVMANYTENVKQHFKDKVMDEIAGYQAPGDKMITLKDVQETLRGRNTESKKVKLEPTPGSKPKPELPKTLSSKQQEAAVPMLTEEHTSRLPANKPVACAIQPPRTAGSAADADDSLGHALQVAARYGENAEVVRRDPPGTREQDFGICQAESIMHAAGVDMEPVTMLKLMAKNNKKFREKLQNANDKTHPLTYGLTEEDIRVLNGALGRKSQEFSNGKVIPMEVLKGLRENGWSIKYVIHAEDFTGGDNKHAIDIVKFETDPNCGLKVTIYDRGMNATIRMPVKDLQTMAAEWPVVMHRKIEGNEPPSSVASGGDSGVPPRAGNPRRPPPPPRPRITADEFDDLPLRAFDGVTVSEAVNYMYPGGKGAPSINITPRKYLKGMKEGKPWQPPEGGGASFTIENFGANRYEGPNKGDSIGIRIKPGYGHLISWKKDGDSGLVPTFTFPDGKWKGQTRTYIPSKYLQYLDILEPGEPQWRDFPGKKEGQ